MNNEASNRQNFKPVHGSSLDAIIELYKKDVDRTLLRENLKLTPTQRMEKFDQFMEEMEELRRAGQRKRSKSRHD